MNPAELSSRGYAVLPAVLSRSHVDHLRTAIEQLPLTEAIRKKQSVYGVRNLLEISPEIGRLAVCSELWNLVTAVLGPGAFACRAIFFNKTPDANWVLGYHQDSVISVAEKIETPGFRAWGRKAGVWQVQPPADVLADMLALRVHLDDCGPDNGALRVLPGSHRHGWVEDDLAEWKRRVPEVVCTVELGGIVAMRPLILHASSKSSRPAHRRVIHIEYACRDLPNGLNWNRRLRPPTRPDDTAGDAGRNDLASDNATSCQSTKKAPP